MKTGSAMRLVGCGFGGVGPALPPGITDAWVIALVEVDSTVEFASITLMDPDDLPIARASGLIDVRLVPRPRAHWDFSQEGTEPYDRSAKPGQPHLLRLHAALDTRAQVVYARARRGARAVIELTGGVVSGVASPWPTG